MIRLVITDEDGSASAAVRVLVPALRTALSSASATASGFSTLPSTIAPRSIGSMA